MRRRTAQSLPELARSSLGRQLDPGTVVARRHIYLDGAILALVLVAATSSVLVHSVRSAGAEDARQTIAATSPPPAPDGATPAPLPILSAPVASIAQPQPTETAAGKAPVAAAEAKPPQLPATGPSLAVSAIAPAASSPGRLPRALALPELPISGGPSSQPTQGQSPVVTTLDNQYIDHEIVAGETLSSIAQSVGVSVATVIANNPGLGNFDIIHPGQTLRVPATNGLLYNVQDGDTLDAISRRYGVGTDEIVALRANALQSADIIKPGQTLLLPGDIKPPPPPVVVARPLAAPQVVLQVPSQPSQDAQAAATNVPTAVPTVTVARFIWPVQGPITQGFGVPELGVGAPHTGVDIGLYGRDGAPIVAAAPGKVTFSGGDACCSYGYYVVVQHAGGLSTLYGHLSRRAVSVGDTVAQGQPIGSAGSTGFSTGTHLHFEIKLNGGAVNPLRYLP